MRKKQAWQNSEPRNLAVLTEPSSSFEQPTMSHRRSVVVPNHCQSLLTLPVITSSPESSQIFSHQPPPIYKTHGSCKPATTTVPSAIPPVLPPPSWHCHLSWPISTPCSHQHNRSSHKTVTPACVFSLPAASPPLPRRWPPLAPLGWAFSGSVQFWSRTEPKQNRSVLNNTNRIQIEI